MWKLLFSDYIWVKDVLKMKFGVKVFKMFFWVNIIVEGIKRCEIEVDLDDMVFDSIDFNIVIIGYVFYCL